MTAGPINLTRARKARARDRKAAVAAANAARHGLSGAEKARARAAAAEARARLDGHRREAAGSRDAGEPDGTTGADHGGGAPADASDGRRAR